MDRITKSEIIKFIENNVPDFHKKRIESLGKLKLKTVIKHKNPYLFKVKNTESAKIISKSRSPLLILNRYNFHSGVSND